MRDRIIIATASYTESEGVRVRMTRVVQNDADADLWRETLRAQTGGYVHVRTDNVYGPEDIASVTSGHFFDRDAMRAFSSRLLSDHRIVGSVVYFLTSERAGFDDYSRVFNVRTWDAVTDGIDTVGEFGQYRSAAEARRAMWAEADAAAAQIAKS